jgi:glycerate 2-kinase
MARAGRTDASRVTGSLRAAALDGVRAMLAALDPAALVHAALSATRADAPLPPRVHLLAVGKAADGMAAGACAALGEQVAGGLVVAPGVPAPGSPHSPDSLGAAGIRAPAGAPAAGAGSGEGVQAGAAAARLERRVASHPAPDEASHAAARAVLAMLARIPPGDALLVLLSGGASSLLVLPAPPLSLDDLTATTRVLLAAAMPIDEINAVRKHIDLAKGGRLACAARDAGVVRVLAVSDVTGDRLDVIGSGPFYPDASTYRDAVAALRGAGAWERLPGAVRNLLARGAGGARHAPPESPGPGHPAFERVSHRIIAGNATARAALARALEGSGFYVQVVDAPLVGNADEAGARLGVEALSVPPGHARVFGGETVVHVTGTGRGGRNQQLALAAALTLEGATDLIIGSVATDGVDGPTDAAGALVDGGTVARIRHAGIDPADALRRNDAWTALGAAGDLLRTGATGTNVADVQFILAAQPDA